MSSMALLRQSLCKIFSFFLLFFLSFFLPFFHLLRVFFLRGLGALGNVRVVIFYFLFFYVAFVYASEQSMLAFLLLFRKKTTCSISTY